LQNTVRAGAKNHQLPIEESHEVTKINPNTQKSQTKDTQDNDAQLIAQWAQQWSDVISFEIFAAIDDAGFAKVIG
jgi:hypothetical protein